MNKYDYIVYIGRFEPPHKGHFAIIRKALEQTKKLIVFIGSHENARSLRDPFTSKERIEMLQCALTEEELGKIIFIPIHNSNYNHLDWASDVRKHAMTVCNGGKNMLRGIPYKIGIIGHKKDNTSYYLDLFPEWEFIDMPLLENGISSTEIRRNWLAGTLDLFNGDSLDEKIPRSVYAYIENNNGKDWVRDLKEEFRLVENYRERWANTPYTPIFVACDALVLCKGHILLIERKSFPGKGLYAMPGGFLDSGESLLHCAVRELVEETGIELVGNLEMCKKKHGVFDEIYRDPRGRMISHTFMFDLFDLVDELPKLRAADDAKTAFWLPLAELDKNRARFNGDHYRIINNMLYER